jgi:hypothetical protein
LHLTSLDALRRRLKLPMSTERGGLHLLQQLGLVALELNDEVVARRSRDLEGFF